MRIVDNFHVMLTPPNLSRDIAPTSTKDNLKLNVANVVPIFQRTGFGHALTKLFREFRCVASS
jgi:hypothetical protein